MGLVEHHHLVERKHRGITSQMGGVKVHVGDHHVHVGCSVPGKLGKAVVPGRAAGAPGALVGADAHKSPRLGRGLEAQLSAIPGGGVLGPGNEPAYLILEARRAGFRQLPLLPTRHHLAKALAAQVVGSALEHGKAEILLE